jgi:hypothetical protein
MALKFKGDTSWTRQVSGNGIPVPDSIYRLPRLNETWVGRTSQMEAFLLTKPFGSQHPDFPYINLSEYRPERMEGGMHSIDFLYVGRQGGDPIPKPHPKSLLRVDVNPSKYTMISATNVAFGGLSWDTTVIECPAEEETRVYIPTVTYQYARRGFVSAAQYADRAAVDLAGQKPRIINKIIRKTGIYPVGSTNKITIGGVTVFDSKNTEVYIPPIAGSGTAELRLTELTCEPVGESGWYQIDESHEYSYS